VDGTAIEGGSIVLCAGTYGSPPVLLRSGIGPADALRAVGVPVRVDLPGVGANLGDHPGVEIDCGYEGAGRVAPVMHLIATFHSTAVSTDEAPDLMLWVQDAEEVPGEPPYFGVEVLLMRPRSRGSVQLRSSDPAEPPRIELPSLSEPVDVERLAEAYRRALEIANRPQIRRLCTGPAPTEPGGLRDWIRQSVYSYPHVVGTCAMGPRPEDGAVVDTAGRVHGTERLSVVDASIMPDVLSGFTHIPTIMIAERLSEQIGA
jgi:choline dehydrogenase